jgi:hypothetical protein
LRLEPGDLAQHLGDFTQFVARGPGPQLSCFVEESFGLQEPVLQRRLACAPWSPSIARCACFTLIYIWAGTMRRPAHPLGSRTQASRANQA